MQSAAAAVFDGGGRRSMSRYKSFAVVPSGIGRYCCDVELINSTVPQKTFVNGFAVWS